ncbi:hypothetical protein [Sulfurimonas sp. HSL-1716]|uniref:tetratricopeptide repeat protein n=1 Tax=Hydrocurvibacter sulfurireducens TaxID=3131937 RepID=UPI0031F8C781
MQTLPANDVNLLLYLFFWHLGISLLIAIGSSLYLKSRFSSSRIQSFVFFLLFNFSMPVIGYISSLWISYYLKNGTYTQKIKKTTLLDLEEFEYNFINIHREFGEGSVQDMLLNRYVPTEKKIKALASLSDNMSQGNMHIIKNTLISSDDEVRLYGFAIIDKTERELNGKIYRLLESLKSSEDVKTKASIAKDLAFLYWEMIYYELSDDSLVEYLLKEVVNYIDKALEVYFEDPKLYVLLGRVYMFKKDYVNAELQFTLAEKFSEEKLNYVMPYLAEINFISGDYEKVKSILKNAQDLDLNNKLYPIVEQWRVSS